jgi:hypothetical protein
MLNIYATEITEENIPAIIKRMDYFKLNVSDDLDDVVRIYAEVSETPYAILMIERSFGHLDIITFVVIGSEDFNRNWKLDDLRYDDLFKKVIKKESP